ncbi:MDR family MFS transporter [Parahaliea mediterranea]|uniref:MDR family MFS transporter n=1 Tax=Parahaliea mediterranea TaxID=651086 RepID=UPI000E2EDF40|nr:MFS transporter [Parahaliea mediterranea]
MKWQAWRQLRAFPPLVWIILVGSFFGRGTYFMVWPFLAILLYEKFNLGAAQIGLILSASAVGAAVLGFYVGALSDRHGRRSILLAGTAINTLAFAVLAFAESLPAFVAAMTLCSIGRAIWEPPSSALIGDLLKERRQRELALQLRYFLINAGAAMGPIVGVWAGLSAQQSTFGLTALSYLALNLAFVWAFAHTASGRQARQRRDRTASFRGTLAVLRRDHMFLVVILANVLALFIYAQMDSSLVQYLTRAEAPNLVALISSLILVNAVTVIVLQFPLLSLMSGMPTNQRIVIGLVILAAGQLWVALNPVTFIYGWLGATFVVSVAEAILFPTMSVQIDQMAPDHLRGSYFGASSFYSLGWSLAPLAGGIVLELWSGPVLFGAMFLLCGLVWVLYRYAEGLSRPDWSEVKEPALPPPVVAGS